MSVPRLFAIVLVVAAAFSLARDQAAAPRPVRNGAREAASRNGAQVAAGGAASLAARNGGPVAARPDAALAAARQDGQPALPGRFHAVLVNGGSKREVNYHSHLQHVREILAVLRQSGVPAAEITVFSGDGDNPEADLATREPTPEAGFWLLPEDGLGRTLRPQIVYENSTLDGMPLRAARKDLIRAWFEEAGSRLGAGDTLLFYVTDHGDLNQAEHANNTITLWGDSLSVGELRSLFAGLRPEVRVVMLMSQCYGGAFAHAILPVVGDVPVGDVLPDGNVCGYFASTADRRAYGCYPENRGKDGIGHSHHFIEALGALGSFPSAEQRVLVTDDSPDVPHASSDFFLAHLLEHQAATEGRELRPVVDELLAEAWRDRGAWEPEIRLLDRIGHTFGSFSPRSLAELDEQAKVLPEFSQRLSTYADRWKDALESLKRENLRLFLEKHPDWKARVKADVVNALDSDARRVTTAELLGALVPFTAEDADRNARLLALRRKADEAAAASYRAEVRLGVVLRMRAILTSIAGRVFVTQHGAEPARAAYERLAQCEDLRLVDEPRVEPAALDLPQAFPPLAEEQRLVEDLMPAYMGIRFRPVSELQQKKQGVKVGAVSILNVEKDSPAAAAGIVVGDIVVGPPGVPFREPDQVREWTMRSEIGVDAPLELLRDGATVQVTLRPGPFPLELPKLPGPPKVGSAAPPLDLEVVKRDDGDDEAREHAVAAKHRPKLLYFWATWCTICKEALPELHAFGLARTVDIVAITDEEPEIVREFLRTHEGWFPSVVAVDPYRNTFQAYGVSGTPTFVLVDAGGVVRQYQSGYRPELGLRIDGWKSTSASESAHRHERAPEESHQHE